MKPKNEKQPKNWRKVKLGKLADITSSKRIYLSDYVKQGIPFFRSKEIIEKHGNQKNSIELYISKEKFEKIKETFGAPVENDLLLTSVGTIGIPYLVKKDDYFYFKDGNLIWFRDFRNCDPKFIYYWFESRFGKEAVNSITIGSSQSAITIIGLKNLEILIPEDINEQRRIADILSVFDEKIELNNKINENLEQMAQAIFKEWFIDSKKLKVKSEKLEEVAKVIKGKKPQKIYDKPRGGDLEYLLIESLTTNNRFFTDDDKTPKSEEGDAIVVMDGASSGRIFRGRKGVVGSTLAVVKPRQGISREFLLLLLKRAEPQLMDNLTGSAIPHLDKDFLKTYPVSVPTPEIMERFTAFISPMLQKIVGVENENQKLSSLRDLLLPKLMSGEIRV